MGTAPPWRGCCVGSPLSLRLFLFLRVPALIWSLIVIATPCSRPVTSSPSPIPRFKTRSRNEQRAEVETNRRLFAGLYRRRRRWRLRDNDNCAQLRAGCASARFCHAGNEEPFALATSAHRRSDDKNF